MSKSAYPVRKFRRRPFIASSETPKTDADKRALLRAGKPIIFPAEPADKETPEAKAARTIQASWIMELITEPDRICNVSIRIKNAVIEGPLNLEHVFFSGLLSIIESEFPESVDLSFATFNRGVNFSGSLFRKPAIFRRSYSKYSFRLERATFADDTTFIDLAVDELLVASGATFGKVSFERIRIMKSAFFRPMRYQEKIIPTRFLKDVRFYDAHIEGNAEFDGACFEGNADFSFMRVTRNAYFRAASYDKDNQKIDDAIQTLFSGEVNFFSARLHEIANFTGVRFQSKAHFRNFFVGGNASFSSFVHNDKLIRTTFEDDVDFSTIHIEGITAFLGTEFLGASNFTRSNIKQAASFSSIYLNKKLCLTEFHKEVNFSDSYFEADLICRGTQFNGPAHFSGIRVTGTISFNPAFSQTEAVTARFGESASFHSARIQGGMECESAQFEGSVSFELLRVGSIALFRTSEVGGTVIPIRFARRANFLDAHFQGADFSGAQFDSSANFSRIRVDGFLFFRDFLKDRKSVESCFSSEVDFTEAQVQGRCEFTGARFNGEAVFDRTSMSGISIFRNAHFSEKVSFQGAYFKNQITFEDARFIGIAHLNQIRGDNAVMFQSTSFANKVDFRDSYFGTIFFCDELVEGEHEKRKTQFTISIDLRNLTYHRIHADWSNLLDAMEPYDRQPYTHLEKYFRTTGDDRQAEQVYLARRHRERISYWDLKHRSRAISQWIQWVLFNYGVRPLRLLWFSLIILMLGVFMFTRPGAVKHKENRAIKQTYQSSQRTEKLAEGSSEQTNQTGETYQMTTEQAGEPIRLHWPQALGLSLRLFIPIVEVPAGSQWTPSENFEGYATLHRLAGALLVPLGIAALTGVLYRKEK